MYHAERHSTITVVDRGGGEQRAQACAKKPGPPVEVVKASLPEGRAGDELRNSDAGRGA